MQFLETGLAGAFLLEAERLEDSRGYFTRIWCMREFAEHGVRAEFVQGNLSLSRSRGTIRGMHFQQAPSRESKLVRCGRGAMLDVIVDLRPDSPTFLRHYSAVLSAENGRSMWVPAGFAHGFQTLEDDTETVYAMGAAYDAARSAGVRWDDSRLGIAWPIRPPSVISERDRTYPDLDPANFDGFRGY